MDTETVTRGFAHLHPRTQDVIQRGPDGKLWVLCDGDPVENWVEGRAVLLGNAARPTLLYQGAGCLVEHSVETASTWSPEITLRSASVIRSANRP